MYTTDKGRKSKGIKLKQFSDLKMVGTPIGDMVNPHKHPVNNLPGGALANSPTPMASGTTGKQLSNDHTNIQD